MINQETLKELRNTGWCQELIIHGTIDSGHLAFLIRNAQQDGYIANICTYQSGTETWFSIEFTKEEK